MKKLNVIKIGGNVIDDEVMLNAFLRNFITIPEPKVLIHGGGKLATDFAKKMNVTQRMVEGRRITDQATLEIAIMVYAGLVNKKIVSKLQALGCDGFGISGADGNIVKTIKRNVGEVDFGYVGDIIPTSVNTDRLKQILDLGLTPVMCAITHDGGGQLLNTNADTIASSIAIALNVFFDVQLTYCFEKKGVLLDITDESSLLESISPEEYERLKANKIISNGMIPKLDTAFKALNEGVASVRICHSFDLNNSGTYLVHSTIIEFENQEG